jgi:hypothetical protein
MADRGPPGDLKRFRRVQRLPSATGRTNTFPAIAAWRVETLVNLGSYEEALALTGDLVPRLEKAGDA